MLKASGVRPIGTALVCSLFSFGLTSLYQSTKTLEYGTSRYSDRVADYRLQASNIAFNTTYKAAIQDPKYTTSYYNTHRHRYETRTSYDYDQDYFRVPVKLGNTYEVTLDQGGLYRSIFGLVNDRGTDIQQTHVYGSSPRTLTYKAQYTGDMFIDIDNYSNYFGTYDVSVKETAPYVPPASPQKPTTIQEAGDNSAQGGGVQSPTINGDNNTVNYGTITTINVGSNNSQALQYQAGTTKLTDLLTGDGAQNVSGQKANVSAPGWSQEIGINRVANTNDPVITAQQLAITPGSLPSSQNVSIAGSFLNGGNGSNRIQGLGGWDVIDAGAGNDKVRGGNGRDIITGGTGSDELWGDFGWNTYLGNDDGSRDLIVIKSDQLLSNWWYGKAGNNPNGEKADIITELDSYDRIKVLGSTQIEVRTATAHGQSGIGIYAGGFLEALYTGDDLTAAQLSGMVSGDASAAVMANTQGFYGV